jgi:protein gp37
MSGGGVSGGRSGGPGAVVSSSRLLSVPSQQSESRQMSTESLPEYFHRLERKRHCDDDHGEKDRFFLCDANL